MGKEYLTQYMEESERLLAALGHIAEGGILESSRHIGATSAPGLPGSRCIDLALTAWPFPLEPGPLEKITALGYQPVKGYEGEPVQRFRHQSGAFQLYLFEPGSENWADYVLTSEALLHDSQARLKLAEWKDNWAGKWETPDPAYLIAKEQFYQEQIEAARRGWIERCGFTPVQAVARELESFPRPWFISSGWALDLFLGRVSRYHQDVDVVISRADQLVLQDVLSEQGWKWVTPYQKKLGPWPPHMRLELPRHQAHAHRKGIFIDFLLTDINHGDSQDIWLYRRNPAILRTTERMSLVSAEGIPILAPELVLLFKSQNTSGKDRAKDQADFYRTYPLLDAERRAWLRWALTATDPTHPWIERLI